MCAYTKKAEDRLEDWTLLYDNNYIDNELEKHIADRKKAIEMLKPVSPIDMEETRKLWREAVKESKEKEIAAKEKLWNDLTDLIKAPKSPLKPVDQYAKTQPPVGYPPISVKTHNRFKTPHGKCSVFTSLDNTIAAIFAYDHFDNKSYTFSLPANVEVFPIYVVEWNRTNTPQTMYSAGIGSVQHIQDSFLVESKSCFEMAPVFSLFTHGNQLPTDQYTLVKFPDPVMDDVGMSIGFVIALRHFGKF